MDFLKNLGFDPILLGAQILNFLIIFYLLKRFLYKPVLGMIKSREDKIALGLKQAEEARIKLEQTLEEEKRILARAQSQAKELIEEANAAAKAGALEIEENARVSAERMLVEAKAQMNQESLEIERRISEKTSIIAMDMLAKSLKGVISEKDQKAIANKALKNIKSN